MRETEIHGSLLHPSSAAVLKRSLRLAAAVLGIGLVMSAGIARAADDEEDDSSFEDKIIKNIMSGLGGTNMENQGIDYRERSPLVVPPKITLPPPDATAANVPNWPKDPDVQQRNAARQARLAPKGDPRDYPRSLSPKEMEMQRSKPTGTSETVVPGDPTKNIILSPSQLGYNGGLFKNMFGGNKGEVGEFKGEPTRDSLTQPPVGYQTPAAGYAYGTGPKEVMQNSAFNNIMSPKP
ncbi:hypothetical protein [Tardiphaga sp.]|uniref:hypothetical protein n=1 Tax=Tardiphaga sp. TaxID=1926292 RepID=UPI00261A7C45|nr:hypothetical protein [Tardiphaga sp.]MDB5621006.1 hypothetical protein [Tardiphaga sp.]